jgi:hypothetical protein
MPTMVDASAETALALQKKSPPPRQITQAHHPAVRGPLKPLNARAGFAPAYYDRAVGGYCGGYGMRRIGSRKKKAFFRYRR